MASPYKGKERACMSALVAAVKAFRALGPTHPCHEKDFIDGIHKCQDVLIHRIVQRAYPKEFPTWRNK